MYQQSPEINDLIARFIQSPHDPVLQEEIAQLKSKGPEHFRYVENRLQAWLTEEATAAVPSVTRLLTSSPVVSPAQRKPLPVKLLSVVFLFVLLAGITLYYWYSARKMRTIKNTSGHIDSLVLADGSKLVLDNNAVVAYDVRAKRSSFVIVMSGDVYVDLKPGEDGIVRVGDNVLRAEGAAFNIHRNDRSNEVFVTRGGVKVRQRRKSTELSENTLGRLSPGNIRQQRLNSQAPLAWKTGVLSFSGVPLEEVLEAISSCFDIKIVVPPSARRLYSKKITADFGRTSPDELFHRLQQQVGAYFVKDAAGVYYISLK
ncbi:MAG TPA: FecR domain-containing protein [Chitinophaga sp.]|uniref:FecR family protein n=1 Tax=Chitinophaga sp. TaxID=1869181 RepID=UPI002BA20A23|nr:FecR domain-containing protein [Chitinophaga sp.]HVI43392.1 FecR domain-containing protein [Chitinophaga sp.]